MLNHNVSVIGNNQAILSAISGLIQWAMKLEALWIGNYCLLSNTAI